MPHPSPMDKLKDTYFKEPFTIITVYFGKKGHFFSKEMEPVWTRRRKSQNLAAY